MAPWLDADERAIDAFVPHVEPSPSPARLPDAMAQRVALEQMAVVPRAPRIRDPITGEERPATPIELERAREVTSTFNRANRRRPKRDRR